MSTGWHRRTPGQEVGTSGDVCPACQVAWPCRYADPAPGPLGSWSRVLCAPAATAGVLDSAAALATTVARSLV
ncbi:hypothetical protein [Aquipuribacter hungaricus]|uniref:Uncharacterized protein n=1 Tax=Aquipuribacter hungaricus TaxID=545624 RepID=A0ABV7WFK1_9MICO